MNFPRNQKWPAPVRLLCLSLLLLSNTHCTESSSGKSAEALLVDKQMDSLNKVKQRPDNWEYDERTDKMTGKTSKTATVTSSDVLQFKFPYSGGSIPTLTLRRSGRTKDLILEVTKGQFNRGIEGGTVLIKFDSGKPHQYSWQAESTGKSNIIFLNQAGTLITKIKHAKRVLIQAEFFDHGSENMAFDVYGLKFE